MKIPKSKKTPGYIIILHKRTKNHDHGLYCSWVWHVMDVVVIFHFGLYFSLLPSNPPPPTPPVTAQKMKISKKKEKNVWIYHHFTQCYTIPEIWHVTDVIVIFHFGYTFLVYPNKWQPKNHENEKNTWRYHHFIQVHNKQQCYVWFLKCTDNFFFWHFGLFSGLLSC